MQIDLIAVGSKMPAWVNQGFDDYRQRLQQDVSLNLIEIPLQKRGKDSQLSAAMNKESEQVAKALASVQYVITMDIPGKIYSSEQLAGRLQHWQLHYQRVALVIGGPEGISPPIKAMANESWSLGHLTLPHPLVRIVVAEALYRAWSINQNHPYHRA